MATRVVDDAIRVDVWHSRFEASSPFALGQNSSMELGRTSFDGTRRGNDRSRNACCVCVKNERMKQFSKIQVRITRGAHKKYGAGSRAEGFVRARVLGVDDDGAALPRNVSEVDGLAEFEIVDDVASTRLKRGDLNAG